MRLLFGFQGIIWGYFWQKPVKNSSDMPSRFFIDYLMMV
tara:strand:- start:1271 stop:1387 length:117 start_codon:yes stop_codon:yes gene_type:complete